MKPTIKPISPNFSSGPCAKHPGFSLDELKDAPLGRSHRSTLGKGKLAESIDRTKKILDLPADYLVGIVPASDTGAFEMAMWSLLGPRGVDVLVWESFSKGWATDIQKQLKLENTRVFEAEYGKPFSKLDPLVLLNTFNSETNYFSDWNRYGINVKYDDVSIPIYDYTVARNEGKILPIGKYAIVHDSKMPIDGKSVYPLKAWYRDRWEILCGRIRDEYGLTVVQIITGDQEPFWYSLAVGAMGGLLFSVFAICFIMPAFVRFSENISASDRL